MKPTVFTSDVTGLVTQTPFMTIVRHVASAGHIIERHNHPAHLIVFTVISGDVEPTVGDETFSMTGGDVLTFDGNDYISARIHKDSEIVVTLIDKKQ